MNKNIEMENATFCEVTTEELILMQTAVMFTLCSLSAKHEDHYALQRLLVKLIRMGREMNR